MASAAQVVANQNNSQLSTGPRTPEGKAASARNAVKHGLSGSFTVLSHEDQDEFDSLSNRLVDEHEPATEHQLFLVGQLAKTQWNLGRAQRLLNFAFEHMAGLPLDETNPDTAIVLHMFKTNPNAFQTLERYAQNCERSYFRTFTELKKAKQLQNEADYVAELSSHRAASLQRILSAPPPDHPAAGPAPAKTQYGVLPKSSQPGAAAPIAPSAGEARRAS